MEKYVFSKPMFSVLSDELKANLAKSSDVFEKSERKVVSGKVKSNIITIEGLKDGQYTITPKTEVKNDFSYGCLCGTFDFVNGQTDTKCFLGDDETEIDFYLHDIKVSVCFKRENAVEMLGLIKGKEKNAFNQVILYVDGGDNEKKEQTRGHLNLGIHPKSNVVYKIGVFFVSHVENISSDYYVNYDDYLITCLLNIKKENGSLLEFVRIVDKNLINKYYVVEIEFNYTTDVYVFEEILKRIKSFKLKGFDFKE